MAADVERYIEAMSKCIMDGNRVSTNSDNVTSYLVGENTRNNGVEEHNGCGYEELSFHGLVCFRCDIFVKTKIMRLFASKV